MKAGWNLEYSYAGLPGKFFSQLNPAPVKSPEPVIINQSLAGNLGLDPQALGDDEGIAILAGNRVPEGALPLAQAYAGHQYGYFTMLGDGRAILIGEQITPGGDRYDVQLKGSGRTPYSRRGDGRAALGPMLREYIISEAMHALGIPTTRSLAVVATGEDVIRETLQPGAVLTRVAASHIRVGTFEYAFHYGTGDDLRAIADYTIQRHFPFVDAGDNKYLALLKEVIKGQAELIAKWMLVGFVHGVMNTDNMAISGETIDYGPCAFMDTYDPATVFSSIDTYGRYAYGNQPYIAQWNLARFAETLVPLLHETQEQAVKIAEEAVKEFSYLYHSSWLKGMRAKLGMFNEEAQDEAMIESLLDMMHKFGADYSNTFRALTLDDMNTLSLFKEQEFTHWHKLWKERLGRQEETEQASRELMRNSNPGVIPRNHRVEEALEAAVNHGDYDVMKRLLGVLANPYGYTDEQAVYAELPPPSACRYRTFCGT